MQMQPPPDRMLFWRSLSAAVTGTTTENRHVAQTLRNECELLQVKQFCQLCTPHLSLHISCCNTSMQAVLVCISSKDVYDCMDVHEINVNININVNVNININIDINININININVNGSAPQTP